MSTTNTQHQQQQIKTFSGTQHWRTLEMMAVPVKSNKKLWYETPSAINSKGTTTLEIDNIRGEPLVPTNVHFHNMSKINKKKRHHNKKGKKR